MKSKTENNQEVAEVVFIPTILTPVPGILTHYQG